MSIVLAYTEAQRLRTHTVSSVAPRAPILVEVGARDGLFVAKMPSLAKRPRLAKQPFLAWILTRTGEIYTARREGADYGTPRAHKAQMSVSSIVGLRYVENDKR